MLALHLSTGRLLRRLLRFAPGLRVLLSESHCSHCDRETSTGSREEELLLLEDVFVQLHKKTCPLERPMDARSL